MKNFFFAIRNKITKSFYKLIFKKIFFIIDPEVVHDRIIKVGQFLGSNFLTREITKLFFYYSHKNLKQNILGIDFPNPIGLAGGFDKNAQITDILPSIGFGFMEVGSITGAPCEGNSKPRLWRLKKSRGLIVYYGLKNEGSEKLSNKLQKKSFKIPLGINIAKTNNKETVELEAGISDYQKAFKKFTEIGDYFTINISCPNAFGGQPFTNPAYLDVLLTRIDKILTKKPVFLKISPDLTEREIDKIIEISKKHHVNGFICTNLTKRRDNKNIVENNISEKGGISGKVISELSNNLISYIYKKTKRNFVIIGCGGVFTAEDAYIKIKAGASLVQLITGMIFEGPQLISTINQGLVKLLKKDGLNNISEAVGLSHK
ncbi:dihydroorotate dehydrogenase (quinone) [Candidatus Nomurabacteria bacterium RIFCSPLOWO2_01_FULL_33_24]|uniref:Dihydroorotate dehydrogenase (quinone) n=1 Tax=Candidatus Nomurabacteria bacterium RIFCSPLOWO2_01_FULL_33_24 TaxID=1801765 RepID=A0A1F6X1T0_9BACT|nr:MAG: dihydroorotate dehydrogenase (quinone) [Candidatus Nomurabacteria bacterium RIFCSPLOWO2_01_FULL_33_24]